MTHMKEFFEQFIEKNRTASLLIVALFTIGSLVMQFNSQTVTEYIALVEKQEQTISKLEAKTETTEERVLAVQEEMLNLKDVFYKLESGGDELPFPHWIKGIGTRSKPGLMLYMNKAYYQWFLEPKGLVRKDYMFKTDLEFWGPELGMKYWEIDLEVIRQRKTVFADAPHPLIPNINTRVIKWPYFKNGEIYATGGAVIPEQF